MKYPKLRELREAVKSLFSRPATNKYPFGKAEVHPRFRGRPTPQDTCVGCGGCVSWCPSQAIEQIDDVEKKKRKIIWRYDHCIMCGECERICTTGDGVKLTPDFELAGFDRKELRMEKECDLLLCSSCGEVITTREHLLWMLGRIGEKQAANTAVIIEKLKSLGITEDIIKSVKLDRRDDHFALLCPKCRHRAVINDSQ